MIRAVLVAVAAIISAAWHPALAAPEDPRVIAVNTASPARVSMTVEVPPDPSGTPRKFEDLSVWVRDEAVPTTVTPMTSGSLSIGLVVDTSSAMNAEALQRVQSGATEFLLRLPPESRSMVVAAGGNPKIVAPLTRNPATALSAVTELRSSGTSSTAAGVVLAAQELAAAPAGPRAIVVYAHGADDTDPPVEGLTDAIKQAEAVVSVIQAGDAGFWPQVLRHTGGELIPTSTADIAQAYGRAATALSHRYLITFDFPGTLPGEAKLVLGSDDVSSTTVVRLPGIDTANPTSAGGSSGRLVPLSIAAVIVLLSVLGLLALLRRAHGGPRTEGSDDAEVPSTADGHNAAAPGAERDRSKTSRPNEASGNRPASSTTDSTMQRRPGRASLSDAVQGVRAAQRTMAAGTGQMPQPRMPDGRGIPRRRPSPRQSLPFEMRPELPPAVSALLTSAGSDQPSVPSQHSPFVIAGSGNATLDLTGGAAGIAHIVGNAKARYFGVQNVETGQSLVNTTDPYDGVRLLEWDNDQPVALQVHATGPWLIEMLTLAQVPSFDASYTGDGDAVVRYIGSGSTANIVGNRAGRYFGVRSISAEGVAGLVNTTGPYANTSPIAPGPQIFEIQAVGPWTITIS